MNEVKRNGSSDLSKGPGLLVFVISTLNITLRKTSFLFGTRNIFLSFYAANWGQSRCAKQTSRHNSWESGYIYFCRHQVFKHMIRHISASKCLKMTKTVIYFVVSHILSNAWKPREIHNWYSRSLCFIRSPVATTSTREEGSQANVTATLFYVCVKMSLHIGNGSSRMNLNPDTNRMLINRLHTGREGKRIKSASVQILYYLKIWIPLC